MKEFISGFKANTTCRESGIVEFDAGNDWMRMTLLSKTVKRRLKFKERLEFCLNSPGLDNGKYHNIW